MDEFVLPEGVFDLPTEVDQSDCEPATATMKMAVPESDFELELNYSFAEPGKGGGLEEWELDVDRSEPAAEDLAPDPIFLAAIEQAQAAAAAAGWVCYTTKDGRQGAVRPERIVGNPRVGLLRGNPDSAQRLYGYFAKEALERGDASTAEDVRHQLGLPALLLTKPHDVFSQVNQLGAYRWADGLTEAVLSKNWTVNDRAPYEYWLVAARGILWNRMREDDRGRWQTVELTLSAPKSVERMEMVRDIDTALSLVSHEVSEICRLCVDVADETGKVTWREVACRYGIPEEQRDHFHAVVERKYGQEFERLWEWLGGYLKQHRIGAELLRKNNVGS